MRTQLSAKSNKLKTLLSMKTKTQKSHLNLIIISFLHSLNPTCHGQVFKKDHFFQIKHYLLLMFGFRYNHV